jgi:uncharacterized zinc-type alcohol dehydrogenase-like protein
MALERDGKTPTYGGYSNTIVVREEFVLHVSRQAGSGSGSAAIAVRRYHNILSAETLESRVRATNLRCWAWAAWATWLLSLEWHFGAEVTVLSTSPSKEEDARKLGAHKFVVTTDEAQVNAARGTFDFILDTVSAEHDLNMYLSLLKTDGTMICVGAPSKPAEVAAFSLLGRPQKPWPGLALAV